MLSASVVATIVLIFHVIGVLAALHAVITVRTRPVRSPGRVRW